MKQVIKMDYVSEKGHNYIKDGVVYDDGYSVTQIISMTHPFDIDYQLIKNIFLASVKLNKKDEAPIEEWIGRKGSKPYKVKLFPSAIIGALSIVKRYNTLYMDNKQVIGSKIHKGIEEKKIGQIESILDELINNTYESFRESAFVELDEDNKRNSLRGMIDYYAISHKEKRIVMVDFKVCRIDMRNVIKKSDYVKQQLSFYRRFIKESKEYKVDAYVVLIQPKTARKEAVFKLVKLELFTEEQINMIHQTYLMTKGEK